jgi:HSP20 family protein
MGKGEDIMAKLPRPQAPATFRAMFADLADWLESPWTGPPPLLAARAFRVEEVAQDDRYVIRAELPGLDPDKDIEVTVDGKALTIHAERRRQEDGPCRSEFRYGSLTRLVRLPARVEAKDVTARYDQGVLEVSVPVREARPESSRVPIEHPAEPRHKHPRDGGTQRPGAGPSPGQPGP